MQPATADDVLDLMDEYLTSPVARRGIPEAYSQDTWAFLVRDARERFPAVSDLALHLHEPGSVRAGQGRTPHGHLQCMPDRTPTRA